MELVNEEMRSLVRARPGHAAVTPSSPATAGAVDPPGIDPQKYQALIGALEAEVASLKRERDEPGAPMNIDLTQKIRELHDLVAKKDLETQEALRELERLDEYAKKLEASLDEMQKYCTSVEQCTKNLSCQDCGKPIIFTFGDVVDGE